MATARAEVAKTPAEVAVTCTSVALTRAAAREARVQVEVVDDSVGTVRRRARMTRAAA